MLWNGKLSPRYIGPFEIIDRIGELAYRLTFPLVLQKVHNVFHVSMLKKYLYNPSHVVSYESLEVDLELTYEERPIKILDQKEKELCNKTVPLVKVLWHNHVVEEVTWETEEEMCKRCYDIIMKVFYFIFSN